MQNDLEKMYLQYAALVYRYLYCLTNDEDLSEELMQETFLSASKSIERFRGECKLSVWLCQIAKHLWYKELKKRKKNQPPVSLEEMNEAIPGMQNLEEDTLQHADKIDLFRRMHQLDEKTKEVMYLRLTGELSFAEIGDILQQSETWARVTFYRGKQKLRKEWDG